MQNIKQLLRLRQTVVGALREFMFAKNYLEADTPLLATSLIPESYLEVFETRIKDVQGRAKKAYLLASPEAYLKRLLTQGSGDIFYLGKAFRNCEPSDPLHNYEFTILEWYRIGFDYRKLMSEIEQMIVFVAQRLEKALGIKNSINLTPPWEYLTIKQASQHFIPKRELPKREVPFKEHPFAFEQDFERVYVQYLEPNLGTRGKPTFITDFPAWQSPLAKARGEVAERFELYINGTELINGWTELTDWQKQLANLKAENKRRLKYGKKALPVDYRFIQSLKKGLPECAGAAMGVDRLIMVLAGYKKISDVILFPKLT